jgi:phosphomevalonate kinase
MITAQAPGKVVLWGEYAVLTGAPAAVLAVDRYAICQVTVNSKAENWRVETRGFTTDPTDQPLERFLNEPNLSPSIIHHVLQALTPDKVLESMPKGARLGLDTESFQLGGKKFGIGSSAAICVATYVACAELMGIEPGFDSARSIHNALQSKQGSGIDVAAAWHGGALRYEAGRADPVPMLDTDQWQFLWTGASANTASHIDRFRRWVEVGSTAEVDALAALSGELFGLGQRADLAHALGDYVDALRALDQAAGLGIYGSGHERLHQLANDWQVVYKPCGAGGGDIGAAICHDQEKLTAFVQAAAGLGFEQLALTRADHGVHLSR